MSHQIHFFTRTPPGGAPTAMFVRAGDAAWMRESGLAFERDAGGGIEVIREFAHLRMVVDIESAHRMFDIAPGTRDFRLLRLIPAALRCAERIEPGDPIPAGLLDDDSETHLAAGDVVIMQGTYHAWANRSDQTCMIAFILVGAEVPWKS